MGTPLTKDEVQKRVTENFLQKVELISDYKNRRTDIILHCLECDHTWKTSPQTVLYTTTKTRNHICPSCGQKQRKKVSCAWCGKEIERSPSRIQTNKSGYFYCCKEHGNLHKNKLRAESGEWDNAKNSYRMKALKYYPHKCMVCGWDEDERVLEVHHLDSNRDNNLIENLSILCPTCHRKITLNYYELTKDFELIKK